MGRENTRPKFTRRQFVRQGASAAGLGVALGWAQGPSTWAAAKKNPFSYDVQRLSRTDPKLIHYEEISRIASPRAQPRRLAIGPEGEIYVATRDSISVLDGRGVVQREIELTAPAGCLEVTPEAELFVGLRDHLEVFDRKGQRRAVWETLGPRTWLTGLVVTNSDVFLADAGNRIVWRCDRSGKLLGRIGERNRARSIPGFVVPSPFFDVRMRGDGLLRVTNPGRHRVEAYTVQGDLELAWGRPSAAIDGFCGCCNPINLALLPDGRFVTCEKGLPRVKVYATDGSFESVVAGAESFPENASSCSSVSDCKHGGLDAAVDSQGRIYILDLVKADIRVMARKRIVSTPGTGAGRAVL